MIQVERRLEDQEYLANHPEIETAISIIARVTNSFPGYSSCFRRYGTWLWLWPSSMCLSAGVTLRAARGCGGQNVVSGKVALKNTKFD